MRQKTSPFVIASIAIASLLGLISAEANGQTSGPASPNSASQNAAQAPQQPYDWKASFANYPTGKLTRTRDGNRDLQGIWSRSIPTPLQRAGGQKKTDMSDE